MQVDLLFINGKIHTMVKENQYFESMGIKNGKIVFLGSNLESESVDFNECINLNGQSVIPGMADSHMHMYAYCQNQTLVNLENAKSIDEMIESMKKKVETTPKGEWIKGVNFDQTKFIENRFPTKEDLDRISTNHPIVIKRCCLHAVVANTMALELAGITSGYKAGSGGIVEFDNLGQPNGILKEQSTKVFDDIMPDPLNNKDEKKRIFKEVFSDMSSKGITSIHTYAAKIWQYNEDVDTYRELQNNGELSVRVTVYMDELFTPQKDDLNKKSNPYELVHLGGYKIFSDGSLGSRSAALYEPYSDDPNNRGFVLCEQEVFNKKVLEAYQMGLQPAIHAIGDRALDMTLTAIEHTLVKSLENGMTKEEQGQRLPFRIIHVQMVNDALIERMKKLPVVLDIQPIFLCTDSRWIEDRIGKERAKGAYAWKTLKDSGFIQTGGSDCPVESYDPIAGIYAAVTRCDQDGFPKGGYLPEEKLSVFEALEIFTKNVHYATGQFAQLGTIEVGRFADFVVLAQNPFEADEMSLKDIKVNATYLAGKCVFKA